MNHAAIETWYANYYTHFGYYENSVHSGCCADDAYRRDSRRHAFCAGWYQRHDGGGQSRGHPAGDPGTRCHSLVPAADRVVHDAGARQCWRLRRVDLAALYCGRRSYFLEKLKEAVRVFGPVMTEAYGQVEAPAAVAMKAPWDYLDKQGNINDQRLKGIGRPGAFNQVAILDDDGNEVPRGEAGEICLKGRLVTLGYYKNPEAPPKHGIRLASYG